MAGRQVLSGRWLLGLVAAGLLWVGPGAVASAQKLEKLEGSIQWIPDDAAYYSVSLRLGEQVEAIRKSRAVAAIQQMPAVKKLMRTIHESMAQGDQAAQAKAVLENPEVRSAIDLLLDMFAQEVFVYGDRDTNDAVEFLQRMMSAVRFGPMVAQVTGQAEEVGLDKIQQKILLATLADNQQLIKVPNTILGFKLKNRQRAVEALAKLEGLANFAAMAEPRVGEFFKRQTVAGNQYLTVTLRGEQIPWESVPLEDVRKLENRKGDVDKLVAKAKKLTLVVSLGLREDYLLLAIGPTTDALANLGKATKKLISRPEFKPLEKFVDRRLVSIGYLSQPMASLLMDNARELDDLLKAVDQMLPKAKLSDAQKAEIRKDAADLAKDLKRLMPKPGAISGFGFITEQGIEGYSYQWGEPGRVQPAPLGLLEHIGGLPVLAIVGRSKPSLPEYDLLVKWIKTGHRYFEQYGLPQLAADEKEQYRKGKELFLPLLARVNQVNREMLIPALADGQVGLVMDAKYKSRQFSEHLPATEQPMPMIEPAVVLGLSDAELFRKALGEYRKLINDGIDAARKMAPGEIPPEIVVPEPKSEKSGAATLYWFPLPEELGVAKQTAPTLGLSKTVAAFTITHDHARRLLQPTPPGFKGVLADKDRPRLIAVGFDWAGLVDALTPWAELGLREAIKQNPEILKALSEDDAAAPAEKDGDQPKEKAKAKKRAAKKPEKAGGKKDDVAMEQLHTLLNVLKTFRGVTMEVYQEDGARATHSLTEIRDLK